MPVHNKEIASILSEVADLLDLKGESSFRVRSYRNAARTISQLSGSISQMPTEQIQTLEGVGKSMAEKIQEIASRGSLEQLENLRKQIPVSLIEIMKLEQLGPQRTRILYETLKIKDLNDLKKAAEEGKIEKLKGFGKKSSVHILREIKEFSRKGGDKRTKLSDAEEIIIPFHKYLLNEIKDVEIAGSFRRGVETIGDIDFIGSHTNPEAAMDHFIKYEDVIRIISKGTTRSSVKIRSGVQVDLRIVQKESLGAALLYFTGSKAHSIALRRLSQEKDYKLNEYGIFHNDTLLASETEEEMYNALELDYIEPELREDKGELQAARTHKLPRLVNLGDIRGDLHSHTNATDGKFSMEEMVIAARNKGYEYFAISDHSKKVAMAHGLDARRLEEQILKIEELNSKINNFKIIKGIEVDILEDGSLDLPDSILKELDMVICAAHYNRKLNKVLQTRRIIKAMENPYCNILAHPTGRMIGKRDELDIDMQQIMKEAKDKGVFLEINSNPDRLDLYDLYIKQAKDIGLLLSVSTDAHSINNLENIKYGIIQARRGWLTREDVINTRPWQELKRLFERK